MIDKAFIKVIGGSGGNGSISGRREKYVPAGGPDGGDGGDGGSVFMVTDHGVDTLLKFRYKKSFSAEAGGKGSKSLKHGVDGRDIEITIPVGTQIWDNRADGDLIADLTGPQQKVLVARGGKGGRGNARFKTSTLQFPLLAEEGECGESVSLRLELKLLADVGLVGAPNAGKSSLLSVLTRAHPKIAPYPFTTLEPVLGVTLHKEVEIVVVDIPGLIEGAHAGVGLGHDFLQHVERTRLLIHVVDGVDEDPGKQLDQVQNELRLFKREILEKPYVIAINKIDIPAARQRAEEITRQFSGLDIRVHMISAATHEGIENLMNDVLRFLQESKDFNKKHHPFTNNAADKPVFRPQPQQKRVYIRKSDSMYIVENTAAARVAGMVNPGNWAAMTHLYSYLRKIGVVKALEDAGINEGDTVVIGKLEMQWP